MAADIASADRAQHRIRDRVQRDIGIGMARQAVRVRNLYAAQPEVLALGEPVHVIAAGTARNHAGRKQRLGTTEILRVGYFVEHDVSGNRSHVKAGSAQNLGFICCGLALPDFE